MRYVLDTNILIHLRDGEPEVSRRIAALDGAVMISIISQVELEGGVYRDPSQGHIRRPRLDAILASLPVLAFDEESALAYRQILAASGYSRRKLLDRMMAAQVLVHQATLVTLNTDDFLDIPGLTLLDWSS